MNISPPPGAEKFIKMRRFEPEQDATPFECRIKRGGDFLDEYKPIIYAIDGMLPSGSIYGLTGRRGTGKTALLQGTALSVITGRQNILGVEPEQGRVAYVALENPQDVRMKLAVNAYVNNIERDILNLEFAILDAKLPHMEMMAQLLRDAEAHGPFRLICYDTYQAGFSGAQFNDNADALRHAQSLRELTNLPGKPAALIACPDPTNRTTYSSLGFNSNARRSSALVATLHSRGQSASFLSRYFPISRAYAYVYADMERYNLALRRFAGVRSRFRLRLQCLDDLSDRGLLLCRG